MPKSGSLPVLSGKDIVKALSKKGFVLRRQTGSHIIMKAGRIQVVIPNHYEVDRGTLRSIIRRSGLSVEQFMELL
jgi:predicted RNA binding protein YcfA (HicA-like mRNA interferase family)